MDNETMEEIKEILKRIEKKIDNLGDNAARDVHAFDTWLSQYDAQPCIPVAGCSQADIDRAVAAYEKKSERKPEGYFSITGNN